MPSIRKRIGYLPSINIQKIIIKLANKENLSQSKVVGMLVEEALIARGIFDLKFTNDLIENNLSREQFNIDNSSFKYNDLDELISDEGITYNTNKYKNKKNNDAIKIEPGETYNKELFEQFKQFILFQKMQQDEGK
tara:strand:- start:1732 stop:2139 length:408 start_codon:yes stop_codon:yes gene_type:complete